MTSYSVADAKNGLPKLIDRALDGEEVVITRHGKPVVELRPVAARRPQLSEEERQALYDDLRREREKRPALNITSVELIREMYEADD